MWRNRCKTNKWQRNCKQVCACTRRLGALHGREGVTAVWTCVMLTDKQISRLGSLLASLP